MAIHPPIHASCVLHAAIALYVAEVIGYANPLAISNYAQDIDVWLTVAPNTTVGGVQCARSLNLAGRTRNLIYCSAPAGAQYVRIVRDTGSVVSFLHINEVEVFRGGELRAAAHASSRHSTRRCACACACV